MSPEMNDAVVLNVGLFVIAFWVAFVIVVSTLER